MAHPSTAASGPELRRLKACAIGRIRAFLSGKILLLKRPRTNLQILQRTVLLKNKALYSFLAEHDRTVAMEVRQLYVQTLSRLYVQHFRTYVLSLNRLQLENTPGPGDLLAALDPMGKAGVASSAKQMVGRVLSSLAGTAPSSAAILTRGNVFSLSGRDRVLSVLESDPILAHLAAAAGEKCYYEELFRSHQKQLCDTASSEFLFLLEFFVNAGVDDFSSLFHEVFSKSTTFFVEELGRFLFSCYDCVGLLLMAKINEANRMTMQRRKVPCLDDYLDRLQQLTWPRIKMLLDCQVESLKNADVKALMDLPVAQRTHPHLVVRRYAELSCALAALLSPSEPGVCAGLGGGLGMGGFDRYLAALQSSMENLMALMAEELASRRERNIFWINNADLILAIFHERTTDVLREATDKFSNRLREQVDLYIDEQTNGAFGYLAIFVAEAEQSAKSDTANHPQDLQNKLNQPQVDLCKLQKIGERFKAEWQQQLKKLHDETISQFTNFMSGMEILKQGLTRILLQYTRFTQVVAACFPPGQPQPSWTKAVLVPTSTILMEIRNYSKVI
eukprot:GHVT01047803.1.p1 GENE.GHVT01047803.1~~GHVT01047803.1.p1  ORF type:complete len:561 (+),score=111.38 GHVT01047803.1:651-2333(+)